MSRFLFLFFPVFFISIGSWSSDIKNLSDKDLKALASTSHMLSTDHKKIQEIVDTLNNKASTKGSPITKKEQELLGDLFSSLKRNVTPELVKDTFSKIYSQVNAIWKEREEEKNKNSTFWEKAWGYTKKTAESWWVIEKSMIVLSWTVGFKILEELGPKLFMAMLF